jgi:hypothetical protein
VALLGLHLILQKMAWLHQGHHGGRGDLPVLDGLAAAALRALSECTIRRQRRKNRKLSLA